MRLIAFRIMLSCALATCGLAQIVTPPGGGGGGGGGAPTGAAGGDLGGTYPNPSVAALPESRITNLVSDLALKAPLLNPVFSNPSLGVGAQTQTFTVGTGGVTANLCVILDTSSPAKAIASTGGCYGIALATVSAGGTVEIARYGQVSCVADNAATEGHLAIAGTGTLGACKDSGQTSSTAISNGVRVLGFFRSTATAGTLASVELSPSHFGSSGDNVNGVSLASLGNGPYTWTAGVPSLAATTGSGSTVLGTSPTLVTPALGTPSAIVLTNATGLPTSALTGTLLAAQEPAFTGDVAKSAGSLATLVGQLHDNLTTITNASSPYTVLATDSFIVCDATAGAVIINLPAATATGREISVKKKDSTANACTPTRAGADLIDGAASYSLTAQYAASKIVDSASGVWQRTHVNQLAGDVTGTSTANAVSKIGGLAVSVANAGALVSTGDTGTVTSAMLNPNPAIPTAGLIAEYLFNWPNYVKYSQLLNTASYWVPAKLTAVNVGAGCSVSCIAPDSTNTANELVENTQAGQHYLQMGTQNTTLSSATRSFVAGETFTFSIYGKANTRNWLAVEIDETSGVSVSYFNLSTCATGNLTGANAAFVVNRAVTNTGNGWCRVAITYASSGTTDLYIFMASANGTNSYTGDGVSSLLLTEAQINAGAAATPYAATTDLLTVPDISGAGNNGTIAGTQSPTLPNTSPQGILLYPYSSQSQRVELPAALTTTMQTVIIVADVPTMDNNTYSAKPFLGSSAALGPKLLVQDNCANGSGVNVTNFNVRACWWFGTTGNPTTTAGTAISAPQLPSGPQMVAVVMGAGAQDRVYVDGLEYPYYNQSTIAPSSSASVSRAALSAAIPQIGGDTSLSYYLGQVTGNIYGAKVYFAAIYNTQLTAEQIAGIYANVRSWLLVNKGVTLGASPQNLQSANALLFDGDSQTQGDLIAGNSYPAKIIDGTYPTADTYAVAKNLAIAGGLAATISTRDQIGALASIYQPASAKNVFVGMIGVNDVSTGCATFTTAQQCANYVLGLNAKMFRAWRAAGFRTIVVPMISANPGQGNIVVSANVATVDTFLAHGMTTGASITVASSGNGSLDGTYTITRVSNTRFTFPTSGVTGGTYSAAATTITNVVMFDTIKDAFNTSLPLVSKYWADQVADVCSSVGYVASLNSSAAFSSLCTDGAARNNSQCNGVSCWQENGSASNLHPSTAGYLMIVQQVRNAIDRAYSNGVFTGTTASIGGGALAAGACSVAVTTTISGVRSNMTVTATPTADPGDGSYTKAYVSADNTVSTQVCEPVVATPNAVAYNLRVTQ